jgi:hypothetical protein
MLSDYIEENKIELQRLLRLLAGLSEAQLNLKLPNGWTVASTLAHLAFWDSYALALFQGWERSGFKAASTQYEAINQAVDGMSQTIPAPALLRWVQASAEAIDRRVESVSPALTAAIEAGGVANFLLRAKHRGHHLNQIEALLRA